MFHMWQLPRHSPYISLLNMYTITAASLSMKPSLHLSCACFNLLKSKKLPRRILQKIVKQNSKWKNVRRSHSIYVPCRLQTRTAYLNVRQGPNTSFGLIEVADVDNDKQMYCLSALYCAWVFVKAFVWPAQKYTVPLVFPVVPGDCSMSYVRFSSLSIETDQHTCNQAERPIACMGWDKVMEGNIAIHINVAAGTDLQDSSPEEFQVQTQQCRLNAVNTGYS